MIGYLEGTVRAARETYCILMCNGVGYKVSLMKETLLRFEEGQMRSLWIHSAVREDAFDLYGFLGEEELKTFHLLLSVSGIGPKSALSILDVASVETLKSAIASGNASYLTGVSGIGKKTAEKIVLELKDKISATELASHLPKGDIEALEAMRALGYSAEEARTALKGVPATVESSSERLREALRLVGSR